MSAILDSVARRFVSKTGFAVARGKELAFAHPKAELVGQVGDLDQGQPPYAKFVICTRDVDGSGDVMEPKGCVPYLERFRRNPLWFYDHYDPQKQNRLKFPIGKADGPAGTAGKLDIDVGDDRITLGCWFTQDTQEARDVYKLVKGKFLRCPSISFLPHYAEKISSTGGYHYLEWELTEVSIVGVPDNPMTGPVEIKSLESPALRRSWTNGITFKDTAMPEKQQYAALRFTAKSWTRAKAIEYLKKEGYDATLIEELDGKLIFHQPGSSAADWGERKTIGKGLVGILAKAKTKAEEDEEDDEQPNAKKDPQEDVEQTGGSDNAETGDQNTPTDKDDGEASKEGEGDDNEVKKDAPILPGCHCLKDLYGHHKGVHDYCEAMQAHIEHPDVRKALDEQMGHAKKQMDDFKNLATKVYPDVDFDSLVGDDPDAGKSERDEETGDNAQDQDTTKEREQKGLAGSVTKRLSSKHKCVIKDAADHLTEAADSAPSKMCKSAHCFHAKALTDLLTESESPTPREQDKDVDDGGDDEVSMALKSLSASVTKKAA